MANTSAQQASNQAATVRGEEEDWAKTGIFCRSWPFLGYCE
jgi:hypothetical protein